MSEWKKATLASAVRLKRGIDLPTPQRRPGPYPVLGSSGISGWHDKAPLAGPGVTIGRSGASIGVATWFDGPFWPLNTTLFVDSFEGNDPRFIFQLLDSIDFTAFNSGSAQPSLNRNFIAQIEVLLPPLVEQQAITEVVGALEEKIAVNERIAATTRELGMSLFFQEVQGDDLVEVEVSSIATSLTRGVAPKYSESLDELLVLNQKCIRDGRVNVSPARRTIGSRVTALKLLQRNDVLINSTGVGTLGRVARWTSDNEATVDSHITIVRFDVDQVDPVCAGFALLRAQPEIEAMGEGSTGQTELRRTQVGGLQFALPSPARQRELRIKLDSLEERADQALAESRTLAGLRDTLLPQLMSGRLRVRDAEKIVEDHA